MAPTNLTNCLLLMNKLNSSEHTTTSNTSFIEQKTDNNELQALLYIVATLLFYSLGITVGIISYLKKERQEMEDNKVYDNFIATRQDPIWSSRYQMVQQMIARLNFLENEKTARLNKEKEKDKQRVLQYQPLSNVIHEQNEAGENNDSNYLTQC